MASRRALVTGGAAGLAAGIAPLLARDGFAHVAITFHTTSPERTLRAIRAAGAVASAHELDFLDEERDVVEKLHEVVAVDGPFDALIHAVGPIVVKRFERMNAVECHEMVAGNLTSAMLAARAVLPAMRSAGYGRVVFFGANGSACTQPAAGLAAYGAAKSGVTAFAKALAIEEARYGITVNVIEVGDIREKEITRAEARQRNANNPRGRPGSFEDVADVVRFLLDPERDFLTGAVIAVTGGLPVPEEKAARR